MSNWCRRYWILKTAIGGDAIGVVSLLCSSNEAGTFNFSLHRPQHKYSDSEFLDLTSVEIDQPEFETHKDVFETVDEVEIIKEWTNSTGMSMSVLVRKAEKKP
jgi:hypothetical protein